MWKALGRVVIFLSGISLFETDPTGKCLAGKSSTSEDRIPRAQGICVSGHPDSDSHL
jgi:hypothetical protein